VKSWSGIRSANAILRTTNFARRPGIYVVHRKRRGKLDDPIIAASVARTSNPCAIGGRCPLSSIRSQGQIRQTLRTPSGPGHEHPALARPTPIQKTLRHLDPPPANSVRKSSRIQSTPATNRKNLQPFQCKRRTGVGCPKLRGNRFPPPQNTAVVRWNLRQPLDQPECPARLDRNNRWSFLAPTHNAAYRS